MKLKGIKLEGAYRVIYDTTSITSIGIYNEKGNRTYYEDSNGYWEKSEYDKKGNRIYYGNSNGEIIDERVKELTIEEIERLLGYKIKIKGETK